MDDRQSASARLITAVGGTGLGNILATFLDAAGPLATIGAQVVYALEPLFSGRGADWSDLGNTLEDPHRLERLIEALRVGEGEPS
jgi:hypothetical protein